MNVYINHQLAPCLRVGELEGDTLAGGISLQGQALFANLVLTSGAVDGLPPYPTRDPSAKDPGLIRHWLVSPPYTLPRITRSPLRTCRLRRMRGSCLRRNGAARST